MDIYIEMKMETERKIDIEIKLEREMINKIKINT